MVFLRLFVLCEDSLQPTLFTLFLSSLTYITILFTHFSRVSFCTSTDGWISLSSKQIKVYLIINLERIV